MYGMVFVLKVLVWLLVFVLRLFCVWFDLFRVVIVVLGCVWLVIVWLVW